MCDSSTDKDVRREGTRRGDVAQSKSTPVRRHIYELRLTVSREGMTNQKKYDDETEIHNEEECTRNRRTKGKRTEKNKDLYTH